MRSTLLLAAAALLAACDKPAPPAPAASASAAAVVAAPSASAPSEKPAAKTATSKWSGSYEAQHYQIESPKNEGAREWAADDGGAHAGKGSIAFGVSETGSLRGTASGPLGEHDVIGEVDGDTFRVRLVPKQPGDKAFGGFAILTREGQTLKGRLQASSGDSKTVRDALITITEGDPRAKPAAPPAPSSSSPAAPSSSR